MIQGKVSLNSKGPGMSKIRELMGKIESEMVYVGIPEDKAPRQENKEISNAQLMYIHTNGSPINNIPARPVIEPAIEASDNKKAIANQLGLSFKCIMDEKNAESKQHLNLAGQLGVNAPRGWFEDPRNGWAPNTPITAMRKINKLKGKKKKEAIARLQAGEASESISRPLIDTAQMRKSITYVLKGEEEAT